jgi:hypothetical protein
MLAETEIAQLLKLVDAKHDPEVLALLQDLRKLCPKCEREMVLRTAKKAVGCRRPILELLKLPCVPVYDADLK